jgi:hypothetical protein
MSQQHPCCGRFLHEAVLRAPIGGPEVMRQQLLHIVELASRPRVVVQVLPFSAMNEAFMECMTSIMAFADAPTAVYTEGAGSGQLIEDPALVERNMRSYDLVRAAALSPAASLALIRSVAEDYDTP